MTPLIDGVRDDNTVVVLGLPIPNDAGGLRPVECQAQAHEATERNEKEDEGNREQSRP